MDVVTAVLERVRDVLVNLFLAAPLVWALCILLIIATLAIITMRQRARPRNEVESLFLASATAIRRAREIGEIDAFARRAGAAADEMKQQLRRLRTGHHSRVKIYVDHSNFISTWNNVVHGRDRSLEHDINWHLLPNVLLEETNDWLKRSRGAPQALIYSGMHVYGTLFEDDYFRLLETMLRLEQTNPERLSLPIRLRLETIERWREENDAYKRELTQEIGSVTGCIMVPIYRRTPREDQLTGAQFTSGGIPIAPEKMLDTRIATDLVGDATFDAYDIALLVSEDSDFIPPVQFVHDLRHKHVVHVGFRSHSNELRAACRHRIDLSKGNLYRRLQRSEGAAGAKS